jgi:hypothetical protein
MLIPDNSERTDLIDYGMDAELYSMKAGGFRRQSLDYKRFACAAEAIKFAIEDLAPQILAGTYLEVDGWRYQSAEIRRLYDSADYPLARRVEGSLK